MRVWFSRGMRERRRLGGSRANEHLTSVVAAVLLVLFAVEGATLLRLGSLLTVHAFVGMLLLPVVGLKLASTGWRMLGYYLGREEYVRRGPPHVLLRTLVAPLVVASTITLLATGVALLALGQTEGPLVALHKASFVVWFGAMGIHVLVRLPSLARALGTRVQGGSLRFGVAAAAVAAGAMLAVATLPAADRLQDDATAIVGVDRA
jgi:hypothetical protein